MTREEKQVITSRLKELYVSIDLKGYRIQALKDYDSQYTRLVEEVKEETLEVKEILKELNKNKVVS